MKDTRLLQIFQNVKDTLCKYDYYIHTSKKIIHLSNTEDKIPHPYKKRRKDFLRRQRTPPKKI